MEPQKFVIPGVPLTDTTVFSTMHFFEWAGDIDRRLVTVRYYLRSQGFIAGTHTITDEEFDILNSAVQVFHNSWPYMKGRRKFSELFTEAKQDEHPGFWVRDKPGRWWPSAELKNALVSAGWVYDVIPSTTYFEIINGKLWAKYQAILGSRPMAMIEE